MQLWEARLVAVRHRSGQGSHDALQPPSVSPNTSLANVAKTGRTYLRLWLNGWGLVLPHLTGHSYRKRRTTPHDKERWSVEVN